MAHSRAGAVVPGTIPAGAAARRPRPGVVAHSASPPMVRRVYWWAPLPLAGGGGPHDRDREKKSPETEIGILNVRLHQIGIRGRIWTYLAEGYNFLILSYVFA